MTNNEIEGTNPAKSVKRWENMKNYAVQGIIEVQFEHGLLTLTGFLNENTPVELSDNATAVISDMQNAFFKMKRLFKDIAKAEETE